MTIIGGTYNEFCNEPFWKELYGSGLRAVNVFTSYDKECDLNYVTLADSFVEQHLKVYENAFPKLNIESRIITANPSFYYDHPLKVPIISPRLDVLCEKKESVLEASDDCILAFGLIEAPIKIHGKKVVYDPQSPSNPKSFIATESTAEKLIIVINFSEAKLLSKKNELTEIVQYFFDVEKCEALILKMGAKGAFLYESANDPPFVIPVYKTDSVWPIGSGDVFSASFAYNWFNTEETVEKCAEIASMTTANYCNTRDATSCTNLDNFNFPSIKITKELNGQIYLAGPFFTIGERWLINEARNCLKSGKLSVFSPLHDVGFGDAKDVAWQDLDGLHNSNVVFAIIDGLDSGTLFEVGYAVSKNIKVVAFVQNEREESLKMLEGTNCIIEKDFATAIYKTHWHIGSE